MALGRSFAIDMGSIISAADQKLGELLTDRHRVNARAHNFLQWSPTATETAISTQALTLWLNTLHDRSINTLVMCHFMISGEKIHLRSVSISNLPSRLDLTSLDGFPKERKGDNQADQQNRNRGLLESLEERAKDESYIASEELRDGLRRAAALYCRTSNRPPGVLDKLVQIPFTIFTKQSIRLGVSVWLNIMSEEPNTEQQILALVADGWTKSIDRQVGAYSPRLL